MYVVSARFQSVASSDSISGLAWANSASSLSGHIAHAPTAAMAARHAAKNHARS